MTFHSVATLPFWFSMMGVVSAWITVIVWPKIPVYLQRYLPWLHNILAKRYGFDAFNWIVFVRGGRSLSNLLYQVGDLKILDHFIVDGSGRNTTRVSQIMRRLQSGYLYHYALVMIIGLLAFLIWLVLA